MSEIYREMERTNKPVVSLCLPTNGVIEWVFPVLDSIYNQNVEENMFEVIVTDNGNNAEFQEQMKKYSQKHSNIIYKKTDTFMFYNQLEALKLGSGQYLKLINHRAALTDGSLKRMLEIINENICDKPAMYFSAGAIGKDYVLNSFDAFVRALGIYASWTTGVGIWKSDFDNLPKDLRVDKISPHSCILFANRDKKNYRIYDYLFCREIDPDSSKKGRYDLFKAFGVEELSITQNLYIDGDITSSTLKKVKKDYLNFVSELYLDFVIRKKPCSYDLSGFNDAMGIYFNKYDVILRSLCCGVRKIIRKIRGK